MNSEIWKDIDGFKGNYSISNHGRVRSNARKIFRRGVYQNVKEKMMKTPPNNWGYCYVLPTISYGKTKTLRVHRLVAQHFIPNPNNYPYVNHIDGDKTNNKASNLEWCDQKHNINHAMIMTGGWQKRGEDSGKTKLTNKQVTNMCGMFDTHTIKELAEKFNVEVENIKNIKNGTTWSWLTGR
jgi:hypothetical protein